MPLAPHLFQSFVSCLPLFQIIAYAFNFYLGVLVLKINDAGGSVRIHGAPPSHAPPPLMSVTQLCPLVHAVFGAYFGLAMSWAMEKLRTWNIKVPRPSSCTAWLLCPTSEPLQAAYRLPCPTAIQANDEQEIEAEAESKKSSRTTSDITAMIGTLTVLLMPFDLGTRRGRTY